MHRLDINLLGTPKITLDEISVKTDRHKAIGLLAYLGVENKPHRREELAALLWPDYPRASALSYLRRTLWELNQILGRGWIESDRESVKLARLPGLSVDIDTFQRALASHADSVDTLNEAVSLYRGDFLEGLVIADTAPFEEWQLQQAEVYRCLLGNALERLVSNLEGNADYQLALPHAQRWLSLDRFNEGAYRAIMRLMAGLGDRGGVVRTYQTCVETLELELGVPPQAETEQLYQFLVKGQQQAGYTDELEQSPPLVGQKKAGHLPRPSTPFIGRSDEIVQVKNYILHPDIHLLTLTGPGGMGKTRLAIQAANEIASSFPDGAWFIPLVAVETLQGLFQTIAKELRFSFYKRGEAPRQQLLDYLREKRILLILDNFEHLLEFGRELVGELIESAPDAKLLVTSRVRLNLQAEHIYWVPGMSFPNEITASGWDSPAELARSYGALQLLLERARRVRPDFDLNHTNLNAILDLCRALDGSPLGIELSVAWLELLQPEQIVREIAHSLDFLKSDAADIPARQRSLRMVFDTSWKLLDGDEQQAFKRLCVFRGSFSTEAARSVSQSSLRTLLNLVNKSWLQQAEDGRFQLHEVLRQYGIEHLEADQDEWQETRDRYAQFFSSFVHVQGQALRTAAQIQALQEIQLELENNIPPTWGWLVLEGQTDVLIDKILPGLLHYWLIRSGSEGFISLLKHARKSTSASTERNQLLQCSILETVELYLELSLSLYEVQIWERLAGLWGRVAEYKLEGEMSFWYILLLSIYGSSLNYEAGSQRFADIMTTLMPYRDPWEQGYCYLLAANFMGSEQSDIRRKNITHALSIFQEIGVAHEQGICLRALGEVAASQGDFKSAIDYLHRALIFFEEVGDDTGVDATWIYLSDYYINSGEIEQAFSALKRSRNYHESQGNRRMLGTTLAWESLAASRYGSLDYALEIRKRSLEIAVEVGNQINIAWCTWELGEIYRLMDDLELAKKYYQEALPSFEKMQEYVGLGFYHRGFGDIAMQRGEWEEAHRQFQKALEFHTKEGRFTKNWGLIYYHAKLGTTLVKLGDFQGAKQHLVDSISMAAKWPLQDIKALPLIGIAVFLAATGLPNQAIEIAAWLISQPTTWNEVKKQAGVIQEAAMEQVPEEEARQAQWRGEQMDFESLSRRFLQSGQT